MENVFVIGTRAQLIKVAPVILACEAEGLSCIVLMTGQHHETMQALINEFAIRSPIFYPTVTRERATIFSLISWTFQAYKDILRQLKALQQKTDGTQDFNILVHGDTLTTLLSAYCGKKMQFRVVHLESGLTSGRLFNPFPEEMIRRIVFRMTDVAMCPDEVSAEHMHRTSSALVFNSKGNSIVDAVRIVLDRSVGAVGNDLRPYLLFSIHRFQNIYSRSRLNEISGLIMKLALKFDVFFILHPATKKRLARTGIVEQLEKLETVHLLDRMGYGDFIRMAGGAECVLTDGGSNQEELAFLGIPTIIMRDYTERSDGVRSNAIMENEVSGGIFDYLMSGKYLALRKDKMLLKQGSPSQNIAVFLKNMNS